MNQFPFRVIIPEKFSGGSRGGPLFVDQTKGRRSKKSFWRPDPPLISGSGWLGPSLIWTSGSATEVDLKLYSLCLLPLITKLQCHLPFCILHSAFYILQMKYPCCTFRKRRKWWVWAIFKCWYSLLTKSNFSLFYFSRHFLYNGECVHPNNVMSKI